MHPDPPLHACSMLMLRSCIQPRILACMRGHKSAATRRLQACICIQQSSSTDLLRVCIAPCVHLSQAWTCMSQRLLGFEASLGTISRYLLKHSSTPICVLPPVSELPDSAA